VPGFHAVDLFKRTRQFSGWSAATANAFAAKLDGIISRHLELGFSVILRADDYVAVYREGERPRTPQDSKYGVCFRACLAFLPSYIAAQLEASDPPRDRQHRIDFALEDGHRNTGDAKQLPARITSWAGSGRIY
jgi:hypothetical protein